MSFFSAVGGHSFASMTHEVILDGRIKAVPGSWNSLTRPLLLRIVGVLYSPHDNETQLRIRLLSLLLQVPLATVLLRFTPEQIIQIKWLTDFVLSEAGLTVQLLPSLRPRWWQRRLYAPRENFRDVRFLEFIFADAYFIAYCKAPAETQWLDNLVATLYRPQRRPYRPRAVDYQGDRRQPFNSIHVATRAARLATLGMAEKLAVLTWYRGCRAKLEQDFKLVFTAANQEGATQGSDGWAHVARELSGGIFGTLDQTENQLVRDVLAKMNDDALRAEAQRDRDRQHQPA